VTGDGHVQINIRSNSKILEPIKQNTTLSNKPPMSRHSRKKPELTMAKLGAREAKKHGVKDFSSLRSTNKLAAIKVPNDNAS
jgi:hypothetical protein